jgi:hypothetical protein
MVSGDRIGGDAPLSVAVETALRHPNRRIRQAGNKNASSRGCRGLRATSQIEWVSRTGTSYLYRLARISLAKLLKSLADKELFDQGMSRKTDLPGTRSVRRAQQRFERIQIFQDNASFYPQ